MSGILPISVIPACPESSHVQLSPHLTSARAYAHAPYLWYTFAGIGFAAFAALLVFRWVTGRLDRGHRA